MAEQLDLLDLVSGRGVGNNHRGPERCTSCGTWVAGDTHFIRDHGGYWAGQFIQTSPCTSQRLQASNAAAAERREAGRG